MTKPTLFAGTSGWAYPSWKPGFYPREVSSRKFLEHYSSRLNSVEVNYTFRKMVGREQLQDWLAATPEDFRFSFKAPATITHIHRLRDCRALLAEFLASLTPVVKAGKQGAVLLQLPPNFRAASPGKDNKTNFEGLGDFLFRTRQLRSRSKWKFAIEFRDAGWFDDEVYARLRRHNLALCTAESDELQTPQVRTADFSYARLRRSKYSRARLRRAVGEQIQLALQGVAYCYVKHEDTHYSPLRAETLLRAWRREQGR